MEKISTYIIILAAGKATRLKPLSYKVPKPLIEIGGKTLISRIISTFDEAGFKKFVILIGYKGDYIRKEVQNKENLEIDFVYQSVQKGMADGLELALKYLLEKEKAFENFFLSAADVVFSKNEIIQMYKLFKNSSADMVLSLMKSNDLNIAKGHANVKISKSSHTINDTDIKHGLKINDIIEKPGVSQILSNYYSLPLYLFNKKILSYLGDIPLSSRREKELQDAIKNSIKNQENVRGINIVKENITEENVGSYHLTNLKDIIKMNLRFISPETKLKSKAFSNVIIGKNCKIGYKSKLSNTVLFDNVIIGEWSSLNWCIVDENIELSEKFKESNSFITKNEDNELDIIKFH